MRHLPRHLMLLSALSMMAAGAPAAPEDRPGRPEAANSATIPDTPAGRRFSAWLTALNARDRDALAAHVASYAPGTPAPPVEAMLNVRERSGGFDIRKIEESSDNRIVVLLQQRAGEHFVRASMVVDETPEHRITAAPIAQVATPPEFAVARLADTDLATQLAAQLEAFEASDRFAGAVLILKGDKTVFAGAYGLADRDGKRPNTMESKFRIGSMGKMFTATAMLQLVQAGKVALSDPVGKYLPDYPNKDVAAKVTIQQLLTHTGGTGDIFTPEFEAHAKALKTLKDYVALFGNNAPRFEPGSRFEYSNYGYILLGRIIEAASGEDYYGYLQRHVFDPAGMRSTGFWLESQPVAGRVVGYDPGPTGFTATPGVPTDRASPAGGATSTTGDMARFAQALLGHKLLDAAHTDLLTTGKVHAGPEIQYAFGFGDVARGTPSHHFGHNGGAPGQNGDLEIYPQAGYIVVILSNLSPPAAERVSTYVANRLKI